MPLVIIAPRTAEPVNRAITIQASPESCTSTKVSAAATTRTPRATEEGIRRRSTPRKNQSGVKPVATAASQAMAMNSGLPRVVFEVK